MTLNQSKLLYIPLLCMTYQKGGIAKSTSQAEAMLNSKKIKSITLVIVELHSISGAIRQLVSQFVS